MVNVGGRSKGCSQCRRRRVKCDETRPTCLRCQRNGFDCDGPRELAFVEATIVRSRRRIDPPQGTVPMTPIESEASSSVSTQLPTSPISLPENAKEHYIMFARSRLAAGGPVDIALQQLLSNGIKPYREDPATADCRTSHLYAVLSFATLLFGAQHRQTDIVQQGYARHGVTLQTLNRALSEPNCFEYDEIIVSVTTLAIQETLVPTGPQFFANHMLGLEKLLALRDPSVYCSPKSVGLYRCLRHMLLIVSLNGCTPSILAKPEWKAILRQSCDTDQKRQEQDLFDVLADCSVLICECNQVLKVWEEEDDDRESRIDLLKARAQALLDNLQAWRTLWETDETNKYAERPAPTTSLESPRNNALPTTPTDIIFFTTFSTLQFLLYNIAIIHVLQVLISLPIESDSKAELTSATYDTLWETCRALPYQSNLQVDMESHASPVVQWAMWTVQARLKGDESVEAKRILDVLHRKSMV